MKTCNWTELVKRFKAAHCDHILDEEQKVFNWVMLQITDCGKINWKYLTEKYASEQPDGKMFNMEWLVFYWISNQEEFNMSNPLIYP